MSLLADLRARGLIEQTSDEGIEKILASEKVTCYVGFDPTAASLHVGSLLQIVGLMRMQRAGHRPIAVVGGATGMIGDPSGKSAERQFLDEQTLAKNVAGIRAQLERFLGRGDDWKLVNNWDWFQGVGYIEFLRRVGKLFSVNMMMAKESVRARLEDRDQGISYTEFSYMLLQSYDFLWLHEHEGCSFQFGGSDQWGNITAGIDLIRRVRGKPAYGFTQPLITTSDGKKFGKSEGKNIWLDPALTSPQEMFHYFLNSDDRDAGRLLKYFSLRPVAELEGWIAEAAAAPEKRLAQWRLAGEVVGMVHGEEAARAAEAQERAVFAGDVSHATPDLVKPRALLDAGCPILQLLVETGLAPSASQARRDVEGGGVSLNGEKVGDVHFQIVRSHGDGPHLLQKGKKSKRVIKFE